jgi:serine/threonine protein phosphatase 1
VERLCHGLQHCELVALRGNHEEAMLSFLAGRPSGRQWLEFGGKETLRSYGVDLTSLGRGRTTPDDLRAALTARLPQAHLDFLSAMPASFELGGYLFVHAGLRPGVAIAAQSEQDLVWIRDEFLRWDGPFEKKVVHGHTPAAEPEFRDNRINLDTGAYATGRLTAAVLEDAFVTLI